MDKWAEKVAEKDIGTKKGWQNAAFDDSNWKSMAQPMAWSKTELANFHGAVWLRKTVDIPAAWANKDLAITLGPIDDIDMLYVNGQVIGHTTRWDIPRKYTIPAKAIKTGSNIMAIRVIDTGGEGGIYGNAEQMALKAHIQAENEQSRRQMEETEGLWISMMTDDLQHWADYNIYNVEQYEAYLYHCCAYEIISDRTSKSHARSVLADCNTVAEMKAKVKFYAPEAV